MPSFMCKKCRSVEEGDSCPGVCGNCKAYNTMDSAEAIMAQAAAPPAMRVMRDEAPRMPVGGPRSVPITLLSETPRERILTGIGELDRVLGGGMVLGSVNLIAGDPGIGKSTLLLQAADRIAVEYDRPVLYASAEESKEQIGARGRRMGIDTDRLHVLSATTWEEVEQEIDELEPILVIIDSVQMFAVADETSLPGSIAQVKAVAQRLYNYTHQRESFGAFLVSHVTKDGDVQGPRTLEHVVDANFMFEGEKGQSVRTLTVRKNRNGPNTERGMIEMTGGGFQDVENPSAYYLEQRRHGVPGSVVTATCGADATRAMLIEVQALVTAEHDERRSVVPLGVDKARLAMLLAALDRHANIDAQTGNRDVYVNIPGGISSKDEGIDLAFMVSIASSMKDTPIASDLIVMGECDITGAVRDCSQIALRLEEAIRMGFRRALIPRQKGLRDEDVDLELIRVETLADALDVALDGDEADGQRMTRRTTAAKESIQ